MTGPLVAPAASAPRAATLLARLVRDPTRAERVTHVEHVPAREGRRADWPVWVPQLLVDRLALAGVPAPWEHQALAADLVWGGTSVVVSTGTASGKSLAYLLPVLSSQLTDDRATALYLAPTKALATDQLRAVRALDLVAVRAATYDGDTAREERDWVRRHARLVLTNPDMLSRAVLPRHADHASFLRGLRYVVVDECHTYRGVFGSHVAQVLRRLRRVCARYGADPVFVLASATSADPAGSASRLTGIDVFAVSEDASPRGTTEFALWEPPLTTSRAGENGAPVRRSATAETGDLLADLVVEGARTLAFVRSRRGAESVALSARRAVEEAVPELAPRVAAYRAGYLPEERRELERRLQSGELLGVAATNALELGVDVAGLDAVVLTGWPGTVASVWQQAGRAGRSGQGALAVFVARDDPLDTYLAHHPEALFGRPVEATVLDPANPYVLGPHLCCAAAELPLTEADLPLFGDPSPAGQDRVRLLLADLVRRGLLRARPAGWFWTSRERPVADLRGGGGPPVRLVETGTGRLLGTVDAASSHSQAHTGAVYLHQGETYVVERLDLDEAVALVRRDDPDHSTSARDVTDIRLVEELRGQAFAGVRLSLATVDVTNQVVSFLRKRLGSGEVLGEQRAGPAGPSAAHPGRRLHGVGAGAGRRRAGAGGRPRRGARGGARRHRAAAAVRDLRPLGHRRRLDRPARGHRRLHGVRVRRPPGRRGVRRARLRAGRRLAARHPGRDRRLRVRLGLPVVRAVAQVRERQRAAGQGRRGAAARRGARQRSGRGTRRVGTDHRPPAPGSTP